MPIEPTPIIRGEDARRLIELAEEEVRNPNPKRVAFIRECTKFYLECVERAKVAQIGRGG